MTDIHQKFLGRDLRRTQQSYTFGVLRAQLCKLFGFGELKGSNTLSFVISDDNGTILDESGQRRH